MGWGSGDTGASEDLLWEGELVEELRWLTANLGELLKEPVGLSGTDRRRKEEREMRPLGE